MAEVARRALVLAGGRATRFGSDKLRAMERGRSLLDHAIAAAAPHVDRVTVVLGPEGDLTALPAGVEVVRDAEAALGPLAGLATGLAIAGDDERVLLLAGDMPEAAAGVLALLLAGLDRAPLVALGEEPDDRPRPLPLACVAGAVRPTVDALLRAGERRLRAILDAAPLAIVPAARWVPLDPGRGTLRDVDRPEDLRGDGPPRG
jgi:molybdopterin-guanine dinucleotide biosynthesis protein A